MMLMVQELRVSSPDAMSEIQPTVEERVQESRVRRRRRWVLYTLIQLLLVAVLIMLMVIWQRDQRVVELTTERVEGPAQALQASVDKWVFLPTELPEFNANNLAYADDAIRDYAARHPGDTVVVGYTGVVDLRLRADGRGVILYEVAGDGPGQVTATWMSNHEFILMMRDQQKRIREFQELRFSRPLDLP